MNKITHNKKILFVENRYININIVVKGRKAGIYLSEIVIAIYFAKNILH